MCSNKHTFIAVLLIIHQNLDTASTQTSMELAPTSGPLHMPFPSPEHSSSEIYTRHKLCSQVTSSVRPSLTTLI